MPFLSTPSFYLPPLSSLHSSISFLVSGFSHLLLSLPFVPLQPHCPTSIPLFTFSSPSLLFLFFFDLPSPFNTRPIFPARSCPSVLSSSYCSLPPLPPSSFSPLPSPPPPPPEVASVRGSSGGLKVRGSSSSVQSLLQSYGSSLRKPRGLGRSLSSYLNHTTRLGTDVHNACTFCLCLYSRV